MDLLSRFLDRDFVVYPSGLVEFGRQYNGADGSHDPDNIRVSGVVWILRHQDQQTCIPD